MIKNIIIIVLGACLVTARRAITREREALRKAELRMDFLEREIREHEMALKKGVLSI